MSLKQIFSELRSDLNKYNSGLIERKKQITPDFNAFEVLFALELPLSRMIGEFLNPDGSHSQGRLFLDLFIDMFLKRNLSNIHINFLLNQVSHIKLSLEHPASTISEKSKGIGRIDIMIEFDDKFAIAIENKPYSTDGEGQIESYCKYLYDSHYGNHFLMLYISRDGSNPSQKSLPKDKREELGNQFIVISYPQIRHWLLECAKITQKSKAARLTIIINEFAEFINRNFCGTNFLKDNMIGETIKKNILEAYEINSLFMDNKTEFESIWRKTVNNLMNIELPKLVIERLKEQRIIDDNWEYIEGKFDIKLKHLEGFKIKKKNWKHFGIGISSTAHSITNHKRIIFPLIIANKSIEQASTKLINKYNEATDCDPTSNWWGATGKVFWSCNFTNKDFYYWDYEKWSEIKPDGKTVIYIADFLSKLIKACEEDIDIFENNLLHPNPYTETDFRNFVNQFDWIFAKTYADKGPHEYIVLDKVGLEYREEFVKIAQFIRDKGFKANYYTREGFYYRIDENYYWTMDAKVEDTNLINRAKWDDYELKNNYWFWKGNK